MASLIERVYPALSNPTFRLFWVGMLPATFSWQMSVVVNPYAAFLLEGSATVLGVVSLSTGLPLLALSLVGGVVADRLPKKRVLLATQTSLMLGNLALTILELAGGLGVWHLIGFGLVQGVAFAFNMPSRQAYIARAVGPSLLGSAVALNNAGINASRIVGPALAGLLLTIPGVGIGGTFVAMTLMNLVVILVLLKVEDDEPFASPEAAPGEGKPGMPRRGPWAELVEGLVYLAKSPLLVILLAMGFLVVFFGMPYQTLMPLFAEKEYGVGAAGLGTLMAATGLGALLGSLVVAGLSRGPASALLQLGAGVGFGLSLTAFALAPDFPLALAALFAVGCLSSGYHALNNTLIMTNTEPRLYGRVMSVYLLTYATMPLGAMPMAYLADQIGGRPTVAVAGLVVAVVVGGMGLAFPAFRRTG